MTNSSQAPSSGLPVLPRDLTSPILDAAPVGIVITEAAIEEPAPRILYVNQMYTQMTGYSLEQSLGRSPRILQGPASSRVVLDRLRQSLLLRQPFEGETVNYRADGSSFLMQWSVRPVTSEVDGKTYFFAFQRDVTEQRRLEALSEASNLMDNVGYVFSGIRHELGNPINSIKAAVTLVRRGLDTYPKERIAATLDRVLDEVRRVEYLLRELRSFNAIETPTRENVDVEAYFLRFIDLVAQDCESRGCAVELAIAPGAPSTAPFDPRALHQVLLNLTTNALDAMTSDEERPSVTDLCRVDVPPLARRLIFFVEGGSQEIWTVHVSDTGRGMSEETMTRIFSPFFTTKVNGTGLGLPLVRRILARMGGTISVSSTPGETTTFSISLPVRSDALR